MEFSRRADGGKNGGDQNSREIIDTMAIASRTAIATPAATTSRAGVYIAEGLAGAAFTFLFIMGRVIFPADEAASAEFAFLYPGAAREVVVLAPALLWGVSATLIFLGTQAFSPGAGHPLVIIGRSTIGEIPFLRAIGLLAAQILGAAAGGWLARAFLFEELVLREHGLMVASPALNQGAGFFMEMIFGFALAWIVLSAHPKNGLHPAAFGGAVAVIAMLGRYFTGGMAHPVVAMGVWSGTLFPLDGIVYLAAPTLGAISAGVLRRVLSTTLA